MTEDGRAEENPFRLPTDEQIFVLREREQASREQKKAGDRRKPLWERTAATPLSSAARELLRDGPQRKAESKDRDAPSGSERRRDVDDLRKFIEKKRQMFLVEMTLDIKRDEIRKLDERARLKNEALKKSEIMLEEDATRFDSFLRDNDQRTLNAIKLADDAYKRRQTAQNELKRKQLQIQQVQTEISKLTDQRDLYLRYKEFLDTLTPAEFVEQQREVKRARQEGRLEERRQAVRRQWQQVRDAELETFERSVQVQVQEFMAKGLSRRKAEERARAARPPTPPAPSTAHLELTSSGEDLPMYFVDPGQLFKIFTNIEEETLFLIQHSQETTHTLEELVESSKEKRRALDAQIAQLHAQADELTSQIDKAERRAATLSLQMKASDDDDPNRIFLGKLQGVVQEVYRACGFSQQKDILGMLTDLEGRLEDLLHAITLMDPNHLRDAEKQRQILRREQQREQYAKEQKRLHEVKLEAQKRRAQQPVHVKTGKTIMYRTRPPERTRVVHVSQEDKEEERIELRYFGGDL